MSNSNVHAFLMIHHPKYQDEFNEGRNVDPKRSLGKLISQYEKVLELARSPSRGLYVKLDRAKELMVRLESSS